MKIGVQGMVGIFSDWYLVVELFYDINSQAVFLIGHTILSAISDI